MLAEEWRHARIFADFECALACAELESWPVPEPNLGPLYVTDIAEVVYWSACYGRVLYRPSFAEPAPHQDLDLTVVARLWDGRALALVARTTESGWSGPVTVEATLTRHLDDAVQVGLDERAREALGLAGWYR